VFDDADYSYAQTVAARYPSLPIYLQVGNPAPLIAAGRPLPDEADFDDLMCRFRWLVSKVVADRWFAATVLRSFTCWRGATDAAFDSLLHGRTFLLLPEREVSVCPLLASFRCMSGRNADIAETT